MDNSIDRIREKVFQSLAKCLAINADTIKMSDTLVDNLGLDSLDFLDLMFSLEKTFKMKIRNEDFDHLLKPTQGEKLSAYLSTKEIAALSCFIPDLVKKAKAGPIPRNSVISMMTVESLVQLIKFRLDDQRKKL